VLPDDHELSMMTTVATNKHGADLDDETCLENNDGLGGTVTTTLRLSFAMDPYPGAQEIMQLATQTRKTYKQVNTWFANKRSRTKISSEAALMTPMQRFVEETSTHRWIGQTPIQRWIEETPMQRWIEETPKGDTWTALSAQKSFIDDLILLESSAVPQSDFTFMAPRPQRKGRRLFQKRKVSNLPTDTSTPSTVPSPLYVCTFCHIPLSSRSAWKRHEATQHAPRELWVCLAMADGILDGKCLFCARKDADRAHIAQHRVEECASRPLADRTFARKDHLIQHLRVIHGYDSQNHLAIDGWEQEPPNQGEALWNCGFCGATLSTWDTRADHIAAHFVAGSTMSSWEGPLKAIRRQQSQMGDTTQHHIPIIRGIPTGKASQLAGAVEYQGPRLTNIAAITSENAEDDEHDIETRLREGLGDWQLIDPALLR
jgi:hypothetical protein